MADGTGDVVLHDLVQFPSAFSALNRVGSLILLLAGITTFGVIAVALFPHESEVGPWSFVFAGVFLISWCSGFLPGLAAERAGIQSYSIAALLLVPYAVGDTCTAPWINTGWIAIAAVLGAVMAMPLWRALRLVAFVVALDAASVLAPRPLVATADTWVPVIGLWAGPLYLIVVGCGLALLRDAWARSAIESDDAVVAAHVAYRTSQRHEAVLAARRQSQRRVHETMLNTLVAVRNGVGRRNRLQVEETSRADLDHLESGSRYGIPVSVGIVIADATAAVANELDCVIQGAQDPMLSAISANTLREAIVESLRTVIRHSKSRQARLSSSVTATHISVQIQDDGAGFARNDGDHFGIDRAIREPITLLGGTVDVIPLPGDGSEIRILLPVENIERHKDDLRSLLEVLVGPIVARLSAISPIYFGILTVGFVASQYTNWWVLAGAFAAFSACVLGCALLWSTRMRRPLAVLSFIVLAANFLLIPHLVTRVGIWVPDGDANYITMNWMISAGISALVVSLLAMPLKAYAWLPFTLPLVAALFIGVDSAEPEDFEPLETLALTFVFVGVAIFAAVRLFQAIERQRLAALADWARVQELQMRAHEQDAWNATIQGVPDSVIAFVSGIADGQLDPGSDAVIARARDEELILRSYLLQVPETSRGLLSGARPLRRPDPWR